MTAEEKIRANAQLVLDRFSSHSELHSQFGYNPQSVKWVEEFIEQQRTRVDITPASMTKLTQVLGSYLGECIIHIYGGAWRQQEGQWGVFFDDSNGVFPFNKVGKQFKNGLIGGDSIVSFFELIGPVILKRS
jgi:hypothetical protein